MIHAQRAAGARRMRRIATALMGLVVGAVLSSRGDAQTVATSMIWFHPYDYQDSSQIGSVDYYDLFKPTSAWDAAAARVQVFKNSPHTVYQAFESDKLRGMIDEVRRRKMQLALESGPLSPESCGTSVEGFNGIGLIGSAQRMKRLGGEFAYIAMEEAVSHGNLFNGNDLHTSGSNPPGRIRRRLGLWRGRAPSRTGVSCSRSFLVA